MKELKDIQKEMDWILSKMPSQCLPMKIRLCIQALEIKKKTKLLSIEESTWRLKSRATWIKEGYRNTKFFHRYANHCRNINTIWEIKDGDGKTHQTQEYICNVVVHYF